MHCQCNKSYLIHPSLYPNVQSTLKIFFQAVGISKKLLAIAILDLTQVSVGMGRLWLEEQLVLWTIKVFLDNSVIDETKNELSFYL